MFPDKRIRLILFTVMINSVCCLPQLYIDYAAAWAQDVSIIDGYPYDEFAGKGSIDDIANGYIVIDDHLFEISKDIVFNTPMVRQCSRLYFKKKDSVYFCLDDKGVLKSIWLISE